MPVFQAARPWLEGLRADYTCLVGIGNTFAHTASENCALHTMPADPPSGGSSKPKASEFVVIHAIKQPMKEVFSFQTPDANVHVSQSGSSPVWLSKRCTSVIGTAGCKRRSAEQNGGMPVISDWEEKSKGGGRGPALAPAYISQVYTVRMKASRSWAIQAVCKAFASAMPTHLLLQTIITIDSPVPPAVLDLPH